MRPATRTLVEWANLFARKSRNQPVTSVLRGYPNLTKWLVLFRQNTFDAVITHYMRDQMSLSVIATGGKKLETMLLPAASQHIGSLPATATEIIDTARAWEQCAAIALKDDEHH